MSQQAAGRRDFLPPASDAARRQSRIGSPSSGSCQQRGRCRSSAWQGSAAVLLLSLAALAAVAVFPPLHSSSYLASSDGLDTQHSRPLVRAWTGGMAAQRRLLQQAAPQQTAPPPQPTQAAQQAAAAQQTGGIALNDTDMLNYTRTGKSYNNPTDFPVPEGYECVTLQIRCLLSSCPILARLTPWREGLPPHPQR
jgi:hypothetical protein